MDPVVPVFPSQSKPDLASAATPASNQLSADFETFLQLLTTQMKNQDPTDPQDSTEFIAQLASFSAVEQQVATNEKLQDLIDALAGNGIAGLGHWVGAEVRSTAAAAFDGEPVEMTYDVPQGALAAYISVTDEDGAEIAKLPVDINQSSATWNGTDADGQPASPGQYNFNLVASDGEGVISNTAAETFSAVVEARMDDGETTLVFADGTTMKATEASQVRARPASEPVEPAESAEV